MKIRLLALIAIGALAAASCLGQGIISTFAGNDVPSSCTTGDGIPATSACMHPSGIALDKQGNLYLSDGQTTTIRKINAAGIISTVAGTKYGYSGDGGPATSAQLTLQGGSPGFSGLALDAAGNIYISDTHNCVIRLVTQATGIITTLVGNHTCGYAGDGGPAKAASLMYPAGIALDTAGNLYIADTLNDRVRKVDTSGTISTVAGNGDATYDGDGVQATATGVVSPDGVTFDSKGNLYISESDRIRKVDTSGVITTIAGKTTVIQTPGFSGDGGPAVNSTLSGPLGMVVDPSGNLYFADNQNLKVRKIDTSEVISTYAGVFGPVSSPRGDGGPAASAYIGNPLGLLLDSAGDLLMSTVLGSIREIKPPPPAIGANGVVSASAFGKSSFVSPGSWIEIYGSNLAANTRQWATSDFNGINAPTSLDGTSVTIGGQKAFVAFISPVQVNAQVPSNVPAGVQQVALKSGAGAGASVNVTVNSLQPGLLSPTSFNIGGVEYVVALLSDGTYVLPEGAIGGVNSRPAQPGEEIVLYGVGFGPVTPDIPAGEIVQQSNQLASSFQISIGGTAAKVDYWGLAPNYVGLYQFNVVVPNVPPNNAAPLSFVLDGANGTQSLSIAIGN